MESILRILQNLRILEIFFFDRSSSKLLDSLDFTITNDL